MPSTTRNCTVRSRSPPSHAPEGKHGPRALDLRPKCSPRGAASSALRVPKRPTQVRSDQDNRDGDGREKQQPGYHGPLESPGMPLSPHRCNNRGGVVDDVCSTTCDSSVTLHSPFRSILKMYNTVNLPGRRLEPSPAGGSFLPIEPGLPNPSPTRLERGHRAIQVR